MNRQDEEEGVRAEHTTSFARAEGCVCGHPHPEMALTWTARTSTPQRNPVLWGRELIQEQGEHTCFPYVVLSVLRISLRVSGMYTYMGCVYPRGL